MLKALFTIGYKHFAATGFNRTPSRSTANNLANPSDSSSWRASIAFKALAKRSRIHAMSRGEASYYAGTSGLAGVVTASSVSPDGTGQ
jgi:hypothetical protein